MTNGDISRKIVPFIYHNDKPVTLESLERGDRFYVVEWVNNEPGKLVFINGGNVFEVTSPCRAQADGSIGIHENIFNIKDLTTLIKDMIP